MPLIINSETIPPELLQDEFSAIKSHYERMGAMNCCERDPEFHEYARENVIARVLLNQAAERQFPDIDEAAVDSTKERLVAEAGCPQDLCAKLGVASLDDPLLRQDIISGLRMDQMFQLIWGDLQEPTEAELRTYLQEHAADYQTDERIRAHAIFKQVEKVEDREGIYQALRALRREALAGADFEALALAHTDKEDKVTDLGWFKRGEFMDEFDLIFFSLEVGELSPVFASHWGFHLAKIIGHEPAVLQDFASIQADLSEACQQAAKQTKTKAFIATLKEQAVISERTASTES